MASFDFSSWLHALALDQYAKALTDNGATEKDVICSLSDADLKDMGMAAIGHRRKFLLEAEKLKGGGSAPPAAAAAPAASAAASKPAARAWPAAGEPRAAAWAYDSGAEPFMKGVCASTGWLLQHYWASLDLEGPIPCVSFNQNSCEDVPAMLIFSPESGGVIRRIPFNYKSWLGDDSAVSQGFDVINDNLLVAWGAISNNLDGSQVSVWDLQKGAMKGGHKKPTDSAGSYQRGCIVNGSQIFVQQGLTNCLVYNYERGFLERTIAQVDSNSEFSWVMPNNRTPTGPGTVMTASRNGSIDFWDLREKCTTPFRSIPTGTRAVLGVNWHPSNPDVIVVAPGYNNGKHEIKALSVNKSSAITTFNYRNNKCNAVGIYGNVVAAATGGVELFTFSDGPEPVASLDHATVGCFDACNVSLTHNKGIFGLPEHHTIACFKY